MKEKTSYCHMGYSFWLAARVLLYAPSHRQGSTYHSLCYGAYFYEETFSGSLIESITDWPLYTKWISTMKPGTCARDRRALQCLALNVHVKHSSPIWHDEFSNYKLSALTQFSLFGLQFYLYIFKNIIIIILFFQLALFQNIIKCYL